jgi:AraC-like DNA-binding protein
LRSTLAIAWAATQRDHDDRRPLSVVEQASCLLLQDPSLERSSVCRRLDVSEGYLSRRFQSELGLQFLEQRARLRVVRFVTEVSRAGQNYLSAALAAGFGSYSQLHRVFSAVVGLSPSAYFTSTARNDRANWRSLNGPR